MLSRGKMHQGVIASIEYESWRWSVVGHTHPESLLFIYATVLERHVESEASVNDGPVVTYRAGQNFLRDAW